MENGQIFNEIAIENESNLDTQRNVHITTKTELQLQFIFVNNRSLTVE